MENKFKFFCRINTFALYKHTKKETDLKITFGPASHHCGACHDLQAGEWDGLLHRQVQLLYGGGGRQDRVVRLMATLQDESLGLLVYEDMRQRTEIS